MHEVAGWRHHQAAPRVVADMHKPILALAAATAVGFALWKLASVLLLPLVGTLLGFVLTIVKFAAIGALIWLAIWFFTRKRDKGGEAPAT